MSETAEAAEGEYGSAQAGGAGTSADAGASDTTDTSDRLIDAILRENSVDVNERYKAVFIDAFVDEYTEKSTGNRQIRIKEEKKASRYVLRVVDNATNAVVFEVWSREEHWKQETKRKQIGDRLVEYGILEGKKKDAAIFVEQQLYPSLRKQRKAQNDAHDQYWRSEERKIKTSEDIIQFVIDNADEIILDQYEDAYAVIRVEKGRKCLRIGSQRFTDWISRLFYQHTKAGLSDQILKILEHTLRGQALNSRREHLWTRVGSYNDKLYYDLADDAGQVIEIDQDGWRMVEEPPVLFRSEQQQVAQVLPELGGTIDELWKFIPLASDGAKVLVVGDLIALLIPEIDHPVLVLHGEQGSKKTTITTFYKRLIDPSQIQTQDLPNNRTDLANQLAQHWVCAYDNQSPIKDWQSDMLARAVTGAGIERRKLYTDDDPLVRQFRRGIIINGIEIPVWKPDLMDRSVLIRLERGDNRSKREVELAFTRSLPLLFGTLLDLLVKTLRILSDQQIEIPGHIRMYDFARVGEATVRALGHEPGTFLQHYLASKRDDNYEVLQSSLVGFVLLELVRTNRYGIRTFLDDQRIWKGTPSQLLRILNSKAEELEINTYSASWPSAPQSLSVALSNLSTNLKAVGIELESGKSGSRYIQIRCVDDLDDVDDSVFTPIYSGSFSSPKESKKLIIPLKRTKSRPSRPGRPDSETEPFVEAYSELLGIGEWQESDSMAEYTADFETMTNNAISVNDDDSYTGLSVDQPGTEKDFSCVCGFTCSDSTEFSKHTAFCDTFQKRQTQDAVERMRLEETKTLEVRK